MPRKSNKVNVSQPESIAQDSSNDSNNVQPLSPPNRDQCLRDRAVIQLYRENQDQNVNAQRNNSPH